MRANHLRTFIPIALVVLFVTVGLTAHPYAYVDLGTGSYMLQMVVAGLFGMIFAAKSWVGRVRAFFGQTDDREKS
jgi:hypothetical protein